MWLTTGFEVLNEVHVDLNNFPGRVQVGNFLPTWDIDVDKISGFRISANLCTEIDRWHSSLAQFFTSVFPFI